MACLPAVRLSRCRRSRIRRDQTAIFLSRFRSRSGNSRPGAGLSLHARRGSITRTRPGGPPSSPLRWIDQRGSTSPARTRPRVQRPFRLQGSPKQQRASGLSGSSSSRQRAEFSKATSSGRDRSGPSRDGVGLPGLLVNDVSDVIECAPVLVGRGGEVGPLADLVFGAVCPLGGESRPAAQPVEGQCADVDLVLEWGGWW